MSSSHPSHLPPKSHLPKSQTTQIPKSSGDAAKDHHADPQPHANPDTSHYASELKGKKGLRRVINAAGYSLDGFIAAYRNEAAFRQVCWVNAVLMVVLVFMPFAMAIKMVLVFASFLSLIVELFNTGLEAAIDHTSTERHPLAKVAKDVGSAAQFLALTLLTLLWLMAFSHLL